MYTQRAEKRGPVFEPVANGPTVKLLEQTQDGNVVYLAPGQPAATLPAHEFFGSYREATREEIDAYEADHGQESTGAGGDLVAKSVRDMADMLAETKHLVAKAKGHADAAESHGDAAGARAKAAADAATAADKSAKDANAAATAADKSAKDAAKPAKP